MHVFFAVLLLIACTAALAGTAGTARRALRGARPAASGSRRSLFRSGGVGGTSRGKKGSAASEGPAADRGPGVFSRFGHHLIGVREAQWLNWLEGNRDLRRHARLNGERPAEPDDPRLFRRRNKRPGPPATIPGSVVPPGPAPDGPVRQGHPGRDTPRQPAGTPDQNPGGSSPQPPHQATGQQPGPAPDRPGGTVSTGAVEQAIEGVHGIDASARAGNIHAKRTAVKAFIELATRLSHTMNMLSTALSEPGSSYGPEITEPIAKAAEFAKASALALGESDASLTSLSNMTVGDLAGSARQAPDKSELTETGNH